MDQCKRIWRDPFDEVDSNCVPGLYQWPSESTAHSYLDRDLEGSEVCEYLAACPLQPWLVVTTALCNGCLSRTSWVSSTLQRTSFWLLAGLQLHGVCHEVKIPHDCTHKTWNSDDVTQTTKGEMDSKPSFMVWGDERRRSWKTSSLVKKSWQQISKQTYSPAVSLQV